jgi:hypothetical protein
VGAYARLHRIHAQVLCHQHLFVWNAVMILQNVALVLLCLCVRPQAPPASNIIPDHPSAAAYFVRKSVIFGCFIHVSVCVAQAGFCITTVSILSTLKVLLPAVNDVFGCSACAVACASLRGDCCLLQQMLFATRFMPPAATGVERLLRAAGRPQRT